MPTLFLLKSSDIILAIAGDKGVLYLYRKDYFDGERNNVTGVETHLHQGRSPAL